MGEGLGEQLAWSRSRWQGDKSTAVPMLSNAHQQHGCPCLGSPWLCRSQGLGSQPGVCGGRILKKSSHHTKCPLSRRPCDTHLRARFDSGGDRGQHKKRRQGGRRSTWLLPRVPGQPWASAQPPLNGRPGAGMLSLETLLRRTCAPTLWHLRLAQVSTEERPSPWAQPAALLAGQPQLPSTQPLESGGTKLLAVLTFNDQFYRRKGQGGMSTLPGCDTQTPAHTEDRTRAAQPLKGHGRVWSHSAEPSEQVLFRS